MTKCIKSLLMNRLTAVTAFVFLIALSPVFSADSQMKEEGGIDSAITSVSGQRDPFWPVGFVPERVMEKGVSKKKTVTGNVDWNKAMKQISIQGVSSRAGNEFFAIINGQIKTAGETVSVKVSNVLYTWAVDSIAPPSSVKLRRISAQ